LEATKPQIFIETSKPDSPSGIVNGSEDGVDNDHRSPITDHRLPLLAFVGDPSSLGIVVDDALVGNYVRAEAVVFPKPAYPPLSRRRGEEGRVVIKVKVSTKGEVRSAKVHSSSSYPRLDRAALAAAGKTRFSPATRWGTPVDSEWTVAYVFRLEGK
jgi:TonB family protein